MRVARERAKPLDGTSLSPDRQPDRPSAGTPYKEAGDRNSKNVLSGDLILSVRETFSKRGGSSVCIRPKYE